MSSAYIKINISYTPPPCSRYKNCQFGDTVPIEVRPIALLSKALTICRTL